MTIKPVNIGDWDGKLVKCEPVSKAFFVGDPIKEDYIKDPDVWFLPETKKSRSEALRERNQAYIDLLRTWDNGWAKWRDEFG